MIGESARVEIKVCGEDSVFWNAIYINGLKMPCKQKVKSIEQAHELDQDLKRIVEDAFCFGYRQGFKDSQAAIRDALGIESHGKVR